MKEINLKEACSKVREKMRKDPKILSHCSFIKDLISYLFDEDNIDEYFYEVKSDEEVIDFVKSILDENVDIEKIEIIPNKTVLVRADAHYDFDEAFSKRSQDVYITKTINAFTGYGADVSL
jgi:hypothetical protein